jgi:hypothetical protein
MALTDQILKKLQLLATQMQYYRMFATVYFNSFQLKIRKGYLVFRANSESY